MKSSILSAKEVSKSFAHNGGQVHILSHVSLDLYKGDFTVVYKDYSYENQVFVQKVRPGYRLFNSKGTGFLDSTPELKQGEVYISQGMKTNMLCETGGTLDIKIGTYFYKYKIV